MSLLRGLRNHEQSPGNSKRKKKHNTAAHIASKRFDKPNIHMLIQFHICRCSCVYIYTYNNTYIQYISIGFWHYCND